MKSVKKIFKFLILFSLSSFAFSEVDYRYLENVQFVSPQKETRDTSKESNMTLYFYATLSQVLKSYKATSQRCSAYYRPSEGERQEINSANKLLVELSECHKKKTGSAITDAMAKDFLSSDPNSRLMSDMVNLLEFDKSGVNPNSRKDMQMCAENIHAVTLIKAPFQQATGYPNPNWCSKLN